MKITKILLTTLLSFFIMSFVLKTTEDKNLEWHTDVKKAVALAKKQDKPLFFFFTGSDWCGWCIRLQKEVFKTPEFEKWAKENVILVELDFPRRTEQATELKTQNTQLQQLFQVQGYPTVWFVQAQEKEGKINFQQLGSTGYVAGGPAVWIDGANKILKNYSSNKKQKK
ncbi:Disulfide bond reductase DsbH precursor [Flavobacterium columnare]|uniref:Thioredoxin family protein n=2 Tax=Flavobacterium TaxID=237 RepID=A0ABW8PR38_9FLAO|nr:MULTISPECIES: thioredoxin family protein [Flavobacterium]QYS89815.1 thioredoxin family protein [Flavobacterium davisii]SPE76847.1 Disulfide bond reductase DsbH precursor [Flavobacterium columnare]